VRGRRQKAEGRRQKAEGRGMVTESKKEKKREREETDIISEWIRICFESDSSQRKRRKLCLQQKMTE
jgi:hypothetical protein